MSRNHENLVGVRLKVTLQLTVSQSVSQSWQWAPLVLMSRIWLSRQLRF